MAQFTTRQAL
ncbi:unnamed protein product [Linum tenue]|uniref:Uncharacterized protein n=1 Tax=Linum tenue TaxID=586396 RepID=A0AAV0LM91_9ROSI|nr:unnamed protein product [Linum tenue]